MASFNVLTEPWIPVVDDGGVVREYGILEVLARAHELNGVTDPAPPFEFGMYRLLTAFLLDALQLAEPRRLLKVFQAGKFDAGELRRYAESVGWNRFDLFDPAQPFLQSAPSPDEKAKSVAELFQWIPTGTFSIHFNHSRPEDQAIAPAICARALTAVAPFMTAGGAGYSPSINGSPPLYVLVQGKNLFETLLLNSYALSDLGLKGKEPPAWASATDVTPKASRVCGSLLEGLTWRPRRVTLFPGEGGKCTYTDEGSDVLVRNIVLSFGFKYDGENWTDPQVAYRSTDKGRFPLRAQEDRELWRDTGPLMALREGDYAGLDGRLRFERPRVIGQWQELKEAGLIDEARELDVVVYGLRTDGKMKIFEWQRERLALPAQIAGNPLAGAQLQNAVDLADSVAYCLKVALKQAYPRKGGGNKAAFDRLIDSSSREFWRMVRAEFEGGFLSALVEQDRNDSAAPAALLGEWKKTIHKTGQTCLEQALDSLDADSDALERQVDARGFFRGVVRARLYPEESTARKQKKGGRNEK